MSIQQLKSSKGTVSVEAFQGRLRLRLPRQLYDGKQKYLTLGLPDTSEHRRIAELKAAEIEKDILFERFDHSLNKYKPNQQHKPVLTIVQSITPKVKLSDLWEQYVNYKSKFVQETTVKSTYRRVGNCIKEMTITNYNDANEVRVWLLENKTVNTTKRILTHISACCDWAVDTNRITNNPYNNMAGKIKSPNVEYDNIEPFTTQERDAIIAAFEEDKYYSYYAPFVKFLFLTGCRTGEAIGLQWLHINNDCSVITFSESYNSQHKIRKDTKNHKVRKFPCNSTLQSFLLSIRPDPYTPDEPVFKSKTGGYIDGNDFNNRAWRGYKNNHGNQTVGIVTRLVNEGIVEKYRPQYNTRHTFISMMLESGVSVQQTAKWVGNSTEIIVRYYAGTVSQIQVPDM